MTVDHAPDTTGSKKNTVINQAKPIALRLPDDDLQRTQNAAKHAGHKPTGFVRHLYLQALRSYEVDHGLVSQ